MYDTSKKCGGTWRNSVYRIDKHAEVKLSKPKQSSTFRGKVSKTSASGKVSTSKRSYPARNALLGVEGKYSETNEGVGEYWSARFGNGKKPVIITRVRVKNRTGSKGEMLANTSV
jgi:hypothetical protein